jgi:hypothetical protein
MSAAPTAVLAATLSPEGLLEIRSPRLPGRLSGQSTSAGGRWTAFCTAICASSAPAEARANRRSGALARDSSAER